MPSKVPYDNDPRPLRPANPNLREVRRDEGPSPTQDGPRRGTTAAADDMSYLDTSGEMYSYLGHFRKEKFLEEGHNSVLDTAIGGLPTRGFIKRPGDAYVPRKRPSKAKLADSEFRKQNRVAAARADVRAARKSGDKEAVSAAKEVRKTAVSDRKAAYSELRAAKKTPGGGRLKAAREKVRSEFRGSHDYRKAVKRAKKAASKGGNIMGPINFPL